MQTCKRPSYFQNEITLPVYQDWESIARASRIFRGIIFSILNMLISKGNGYENEVEILIVDGIHWADLRKEEVRKWFAISGSKTLGKDKATWRKYVKRAKEEGWEKSTTVQRIENREAMQRLRETEKQNKAKHNVGKELRGKRIQKGSVVMRTKCYRQIN